MAKSLIAETVGEIFTLCPQGRRLLFRSPLAGRGRRDNSFVLNNSRPPRSVPDVQDFDLILPNSVVRIPQHQNSRTLRKPWRDFRLTGDQADDVADSLGGGNRDPFTGNRPIIRANLSEIASRTRRENDLHEARKERKAASTSSAVARSPRSSSTMASSIAASSSSLACYSPTRQASMSLATAASFSISSAGQVDRRSINAFAVLFM